MKSLSIEIVPAQPGFTTVINLDDNADVVIGEPIIAWRIETHEVIDSKNVFSTCTAITIGGDATSNCIGVQNPDESITVYDDSSHSSLAELKTYLLG